MLNTLASDHNHRMREAYGHHIDWYALWWQYIPWWGNWALITPLIVAMVRIVGSENLRKWHFVLANLLLMVGVMVLYWVLTVVEVTLMNSHKGPLAEVGKGVFSELLMSPMHLDVLIYMAVACLGYTFHFHHQSREQAVRNEQLSGQLLKVELQSLKSQLSPHFLFNTLNTISGMVRLDLKNDAVKALSELSKMFRKVLENQKTQMTTLKHEMEFIRSYLAIQTMRFEQKLSVDIHVDDEALDVQVPFMLLHTLVENAVQHGSQLESDHNVLKLDIVRRADSLEVSLTNKASQTEGHRGFGIGLNNCRQRLEHLYGEAYRLSCEPSGDGEYVTRVSLPTGKHYV